MDPAALPNSILSAFARRHTALLDAMADVWSFAGRFAWGDDDSRELYARGQPASGSIHVRLAAQRGTLSVEGGDASLQPMLLAQARLLQEAIESEAELSLLTDDLMRTTDQLVALYEVSAAARVGRDPDDAMRTCVEQAARLTGAARALLVIRDSARSDEEAVHVFAFPATDAARTDFSVALLSALARSRDPLIANTPEECEALCGAAPESATRLVFAPIPIGGTTDAVLCALDKSTDFISGDLKLIAALADAASGFLERDRNYRRELAQARVRRELEIAVEIQNRLLPRQVPSVPGVQIAAFSRPASEVGGDFFDVQVLSGNVLALALGDVTGRGVPAALFMAMARALLRAGLQSTQSPARAVEQLNAGLSDDLSNADMLLTLFAATFDPASGELCAMNCGHSPVLVYSRSEAEVWEADGPPVGTLPHLMSVERRRTLEHGNVLAVLSDGFSEAHDASGRRIGVTPLAETLRRTAGEDASVIAAALQELAAGAGGGFAPEDDQTLIVMKIG